MNDLQQQRMVWLRCELVEERPDGHVIVKDQEYSYVIDPDGHWRVNKLGGKGGGDGYVFYKNYPPVSPS